MLESAWYMVWYLYSIAMKRLFVPPTRAGGVTVWMAILQVSAGLWKRATWWGLCPVLTAVAKDGRTDGGSICSCCWFQVLWEFRVVSMEINYVTSSRTWDPINVYWGSVYSVTGGVGGGGRGWGGSVGSDVWPVKCFTLLDAMSLCKPREGPIRTPSLM